MNETQITPKTKTNTVLKVVLGVFAISAAGFMAAYFFGTTNEIDDLSLVTPTNTKAVTNSAVPTNTAVPQTDRLSQGTIADLVTGSSNTDNAEFDTIDGGYIKIQLLSIDETSNRANMKYWKYDKNDKLESEREISYGPEDVGWEIEVLKIGTGRATLTVPLRPGQTF